MKSSLEEIFRRALISVCNQRGLSLQPEATSLTSLATLEKLLSSLDLPLDLYFAEVASSCATQLEGEVRKLRSALSFRLSRAGEEMLCYSTDSIEKWSFSSKEIEACVRAANKAMEGIHDISRIYGADIFQLLGLRNLSSFVGEVFAREVQRANPDRLIKNANQDGYPDLCLLTAKGLEYVNGISKAGMPDSAKHLWSPFPHGGVEVKATCGNTPPAKKTPKPKIGESRLPILVSAEWKAHHQQTKVLLGVYWDFVDGLPTILGAFFRNDLDTRVGDQNEDWGKIIQPLEDPSVTT